VQMFSIKCLNVHDVQELASKNDEDNCLARHNQQRFFRDLKGNNTLKMKEKHLKENDLHCMYKRWYIKSNIHCLVFFC